MKVREKTESGASRKRRNYGPGDLKFGLTSVLWRCHSELSARRHKLATKVFFFFFERTPNEVRSQIKVTEAFCTGNIRMGWSGWESSVKSPWLQRYVGISLCPGGRVSAATALRQESQLRPPPGSGCADGCFQREGERGRDEQLVRQQRRDGGEEVEGDGRELQLMRVMNRPGNRWD